MEEDAEHSSAAEVARPKYRRLRDFGELTDAEQKLRDRAKDGVVCYFGKVAPKVDDIRNKEAPQIRASFVRYLALGGCEQTAVHERGIWIQGAIINGDLDFTACVDVRPIALEYCLIDGRLILREARTRTINLDYSHLRGSQVTGSAVNKSHMAIEAKRACVDGSVYCRRGFLAVGEVNFIEAEIKGSLECHGGRFLHKDGDELEEADKEENRIVLTCSRLKVGGSVFFQSESKHEFVAKGQVRFQRAEIGGDLHCEGGSFIHPSKNALTFNRAKITGSVFLGRVADADKVTSFVDGIT